MKRFAVLLAGLGAIAILAALGHMTLTGVAQGEGAWADRAAATCVTCHGG
ncbi:MAG: hypothetical protein QNJ09_14955 [Paracoccaceae bacterium]|nr:hypothetical protein [Paracoccaceae bacterium]